MRNGRAMSVSLEFLLGNLSLYWKCKLSSHLRKITFTGYPFLSRAQFHLMGQIQFMTDKFNLMTEPIDVPPRSSRSSRRGRKTQTEVLLNERSFSIMRGD
jgi:hypothetical protein